MEVPGWLCWAAAHCAAMMPILMSTLVRFSNSAETTCQLSLIQAMLRTLGCLHLQILQNVPSRIAPTLATWMSKVLYMNAVDTLMQWSI